MKIKDKRGLVFILALLFAILPFASALDTVINVKTYKNHQVSVFVLAPSEQYQLFESYHVNSGETGKVSVTYTGDSSSIKVNVKVSSEGKTVHLEKFGEFEAGQKLYLQVIPDKISSNYKELEEAEALAKTNITNNIENLTTTQNKTTNAIQTETLEENIEEENKTGSSLLTGLSIYDEEGNLSIVSYTIIIVLVIAFLVVLFVFSRKRYKSGNDPSLSKPAFIAPSNLFGRRGSDPSDNRIKELEGRLRDAQVQLNQLKNKDRIEQIKRKLDMDREELEKLQRGEDN